MKKNQTRRALLMSALSLLLCVSMLVGSTFAWFTDSVVSANNIIKSGNLDVVLEYWDGDSYEEVTSTSKLFDDAALWEPGYTEVAYLKVSNAGSLALKYQLAVNVYDETLGKTKDNADIKLSDHLQFKVVESNTDLAGTYGSREAAQAAPATATKLQAYNSEVKPLDPKNEAGDNNYYDYVALIIYMPTTVGNEANHDGVNVPKIEMGVNLFATQQTAESDSFDDQYDNIAAVSTEAELKAALEAGGNVLVAADIDLTETIKIPSDKTAKLDLNGKTITAPAGAICAIQNLGTLTVTGNGNIKGSYTALYSNGNLTIEGGTFTATDGFGVLIDNIYGTEASVAVINGGIFTGVGIYNPTDVTINGGTFNVGRDPDGATDHLSDEMALFISPTFVGAPNTAKVVLNGGTVNGDVYVYDDGITETVFVNNGATITGDVLDNG